MVTFVFTVALLLYSFALVSLLCGSMDRALVYSACAL